MTMGYWDWLELSAGLEEAAGDRGLLGVSNTAGPSTGELFASGPPDVRLSVNGESAVGDSAAMHYYASVRPELRRLGPYENVGNRIPPSVGVLVVLLLAAFCIWKAVGR